MRKEDKVTIVIVLLVGIAVVFTWIKNYMAAHPVLSVFIGLVVIGVLGLLVWYSLRKQEVLEAEKGVLAWVLDKFKALFKGGSGKESEPRTSIPPSVYKMVMMRSDGKCQYCGDRKFKLTVHHIDGNHNNHNPKNLIVLCPNDHSLAGSLNKTLLREYALKPYDKTRVTFDRNKTVLEKR